LRCSSGSEPFAALTLDAEQHDSVNAIIRIQIAIGAMSDLRVTLAVHMSGRSIFICLTGSGVVVESAVIEIVGNHHGA
jgi:hypothetical protein